MELQCSYKATEEARLFAHFRPLLAGDLVSAGVPSSIAGSLLNWFDPACDGYLAHVNGWQTLLCKGAVPLDVSIPQFLLDFGMVVKTPYSFSLLRSEPWKINIVHAVAKLLYKYHGAARNSVDWNAVKDRFSHPSNITLFPHEIRGIRSKLECLEPPSWDMIVGRFGPGVTADRKDNYLKWRRNGYYPEHVPSYLYFCSPIDFIEHRKEVIPSKRGVTKIACVPKSLKTDRIVSSEPANFMFAQLGVNDCLVKQLHMCFSKHISLYDQDRHNRLLLDPESCSLDLSDASDHISRRLVYSLLPRWKEFLFSVRSSWASFPDGSLVPFRTFAPMGSGVCFSVLTAITAGICAFACRRYWHVYGDDIIVHVNDYDYVRDLLLRCGLIVNNDKSCCTKFYRESCGKEYWLTTNITPLMIRDSPSMMDATQMESLLRQFDVTVSPFVRLRDALTSEFVRNHGLSRRCIRSGPYQNFQVKLPIDKPKGSQRELRGYYGLNRWFCLKTQTAKVVSRTSGHHIRWLWANCDDYPCLTRALE